MSTTGSEVDAAAQFAEEAQRTGLALPTARRLDPKVVVAGIAVIVAVSLSVGYATGWMNLHRPAPNPLAELPGCSTGGVRVAVASAGDDPTSPLAVWPALTSGFSAASGGCLTVSEAGTGTPYSLLSDHTVAGVIGPLLPGAAGVPSLAPTTYSVPLLVAPVVVVVNTAGLPSELNVSADALAGAFLGTATGWNDPVFTGTNPTLSSSQAVTVVTPVGPSAASAVFSTYLAQRNATFASTLSPGPDISWPVGLSVASNATLATVAATPGSIGFVGADLCASLPSNVSCANVETGGGFVAPRAANIEAAASLEGNSTAGAAADWANVTGVAPTNASVYPMLVTTYATVYRDLGSSYGGTLGLNASKWLIGLLFWIASNTSGGPAAIGGAYGYFALPSGLQLTAEEADLSVTYDGNWVLLPPTSVEGGGEGGEGGGETGEF